METAISEQTIQGQLKTSLENLSRPFATDTSRRLQRLVSLLRGLIAVALIIGGLSLADTSLFGQRYPTIFLSTAIVYAVLAWVGFIYMQYRQQASLPLVPLLLLIDIICITLLMHTSSGISSGIGALLVVFVGAASLNLRGRHAYLGAAIAALAILGEQTAAYLSGFNDASAFAPAGVLGAIIFTIALAANPLARRLHESEALARQRGIDLANMAQLNDYIIQHLRESIVVIDQTDEIRLINQSAAEHLGIPQSKSARRNLGSVSPKLQRLLIDWRRGDIRDQSQASMTSADGSAPINVHIAPLVNNDTGPVVIFLEDASLIAEKVQQTKLAALGRLSASIAHEIRNPVGALSHAGQLLEESENIGEYEQRLLKIIDKNSRRVSEIVDNVMGLSRREPTNPQSIALHDWVKEFVAEFRSSHTLADETIKIVESDNTEVRMDPGHLHQICRNLCENALQYGATDNDTASLTIRFGRLPGNRRPYLEVIDQGPGISDEMREQLFEPFATGRIGGTGLGLFISRELCECNRATLLYEANKEGGSVFRIVFADPKRWGTIS
ncbi:MAG: ATP-binding protein [Gammaproteobacteria bacterium]|nr:ATP-binding protein [Gammaproteobacteria bacterium]